MREESETRWLARFKQKPDAQLRLFCFPHAGGTALSYRSWPDALPGSIQVDAVQLPGRSERLSEPSFRDLLEMVQALGPALLPFFNKPFAFFGHSMGALIVLELTRWLRRTENPLPVHLFVSGYPAPHLPKDHPLTYDLPEQEFIERLQELNGTPQEVLDHRELMQLMIPLLRTDFSVCDTYQCQSEAPLRCPLTVFGGLDDVEASRERLEPWRTHTDSSFSLHMFPGGHFFIQTAQRDLLRLITQKLASITRGRAEFSEK